MSDQFSEKSIIIDKHASAESSGKQVEKYPSSELEMNDSSSIYNSVSAMSSPMRVRHEADHYLLPQNASLVVKQERGMGPRIIKNFRRAHLVQRPKQHDHNQYRAENIKYMPKWVWRETTEKVESDEEERESALKNKMLQKQLVRMGEELKLKIGENARINRELKRVNEENESMINKIEKADLENEKIRAELSAANKKCRETEENLKEQKSKSDADSLMNPVLLQKISESQAKVKDVEEKLSEKVKRVVSLEKSLAQMELVTKELDEEHEQKLLESQKQYEEAEVTNQKAIRDLTDKLIRVQEDNKSMVKKLTDVETLGLKNNHLMIKERELYLQEETSNQKRRLELNDKIKLLEKEIQQKESELHNINMKYGLLNNQLKEVAGRLTAKGAECEHIEMQLQETKQLLKSEIKMRKEMESAIEHYQKKVHDAEKKLSMNTADAMLASRDLERVNEMERQLHKERTEIKFQVMSLHRQREEIEAKSRKTKKESEVLKSKEKKRMKMMEATWRQLQKQKNLLDAARKRFSAEKFESTQKSRAWPRLSITSDTSPLFTPNAPKKRSTARGRSRLDMKRNSIEMPFTTAQIAFEPCIDSSDSDYLDLEKSLQVAFDDENDISSVDKPNKIWNLTIDPNVSYKMWKESQSVISLKEGEYGGSTDVAITMQKNIDDNTQIGPLQSRESPASHYAFMSSIKLGNEMDVNDKFEAAFSEIENRVKVLSDWIVETDYNLNSLPSTPSTLRGLLASIDPKRLKKVKLKLAKITELIEETDALIESNEELIRDSFSDRMWKLVSMEKDCDLQIRRIEKVLNNKLAMAAVQFKKFMPRLLKEYWKESKNVRDALESIQKRYSKVTPALRNSKGRYDIREALQDEAKMKELKDMVDFLIRVGRIFGNIGTEETQDCLLDSYDLESIHLALSKTISVKITQGSNKSI